MQDIGSFPLRTYVARVEHGQNPVRVKVHAHIRPTSNAVIRVGTSARRHSSVKNTDADEIHSDIGSDLLPV